ncbi:conserved Plasmodium protein, unknown function [Plasmodium ovale]|uniref:MORN repeat protein n=1 Tax=Plasmodium ovale TaxID=36330 RepID=A0A1C3KNU8_PLAOA|nr:conserved Plasmodium protein, unknown function [Plasmodium ovale]
MSRSSSTEYAICTPYLFCHETKVRYKNGDEFVGTLDNGQKKYGKYFYVNQSLYEGSYEKEKKEGFGKLTKNNKEFYYGNFKNGKKKGLGFQKYPNGDFYYGEWKNNKKDGRGIYFFAETKEYYCGEWSKGNFTNGEWALSGEVKYVGTFFRNKPKHKGNFYFINESKINVFYEQLLTISCVHMKDEENIQLLWRNI